MVKQYVSTGIDPQACHLLGCAREPCGRHVKKFREQNLLRDAGGVITEAFHEIRA